MTQVEQDNETYLIEKDSQKQTSPTSLLQNQDEKGLQQEINASGILQSDSDMNASSYQPKQRTAAQMEQEKLEVKADEKRSKAQEKESAVYILKYAKDEKCHLIFGLIFLLFGSVGDFVVPLYVGLVITALNNGGPDVTAVVGTYCTQLFLIVCCSGACAGCRAYTFNIMSERISRQLRFDFFDSIMNKDVAFFDERRTGDLLSRMNSDIQVIQDCLSTSISMFVRSFIFIICTLIILMIFSPSLTGITFGGIIPLMIFAFIFGRQMKKLTTQIQDNKAKMSNVADEAFGNVRTVKAFANEIEETSKFTNYNNTTFNIAKKRCIWQGFFVFFIQVLLYGSMCVIIYSASLMYQNGTIELGNITSFLFYMVLLMFNFGILGAVFGNVMQIFGASDKIVMLMKHEPIVNTQGGIKPEEKQESCIELRDIKFSYPSKEEVQVLKGVSITVDNKDKRVVALVGQSGCGKSSIISMIERFYDVQEGGVYFNGNNVKDLDPRWYHEQISLVQQEPVLFSGTIQENILYGYNYKQLSDETIADMMDTACKQSNAYDFIHTKEMFPMGYQTLVGERGVKLSGGQKQRIAIARALIRKPKVLLLDEATSALDAESEHQVQQALDKLIKSGEQTIVIVAHRLSTVRDADEIIVMKGGEVKERGKHSELLALNGVYTKLVGRQLVGHEIAEEKTTEAGNEGDAPE